MKEYKDTVERRKHILMLLVWKGTDQCMRIEYSFQSDGKNHQEWSETPAKTRFADPVRGGANLSRNRQWTENQISEKHRINLHRNEKTGDLDIAYEWIQFSYIRQNMLVDNIRRKSLTLVGTIAEQGLKNFFVD